MGRWHQRFSQTKPWRKREWGTNRKKESKQQHLDQLCKRLERMGSTWRKIHNEMCKMKEKEICDVVFEQSSSSTAIKGIVMTKAVAVQRSRAMWKWTKNDQELSDVFSTSRTKEHNLGPATTYPVILLPCVLVSPGLPTFSSDFLVPCCLLVLSVVLLRIWGFSD